MIITVSDASYSTAAYVLLITFVVHPEGPHLEGRIQKDLTLRAEGPKRAALAASSEPRARGVGLWP